VIAVAGDVVACLGGWRGDILFVARGGSALAPVAELGWDSRAQTTPQRRLLLEGGEVFVLEPVEGHLLLPPLKVRRFDLSGKELACEEGGDRGPALLSYHARFEGGRSRITRCGVDPATGRPTVEEEEIDADLPGRRAECSGIPLLAGGAMHYPVRGRGLYRGAERLFDGDLGIAQEIGGDVVLGGNRRGRPGVWRQGRWNPLPGGRLFPDWRAPLGPLVAPCGNGVVALRREGGPLPGLSAPPASLPTGIYSAIVRLGERLVALAEGEVPALVEVEVEGGRPPAPPSSPSGPF